MKKNMCDFQEICTPNQTHHNSIFIQAYWSILMCIKRNIQNIKNLFLENYVSVHPSNIFNSIKALGGILLLNLCPQSSLKLSAFLDRTLPPSAFVLVSPDSALLSLNFSFYLYALLLLNTSFHKQSIYNY